MTGAKRNAQGSRVKPKSASHARQKLNCTVSAQDESRKMKRGRRLAHESRAAEIRARLAAWRQTPEPQRISLRCLACELGTSHQLLGHYLKGLEEWQYEERFRQAIKALKGISARAQGRLLTPWEKQQFLAIAREALCAMVPRAQRALRALRLDQVPAK